MWSIFESLQDNDKSHSFGQVKSRKSEMADLKMINISKKKAAFTISILPSNFMRFDDSRQLRFILLKILVLQLCNNLSEKHQNRKLLSFYKTLNCIKKKSIRILLEISSESCSTILKVL